MVIFISPQSGEKKQQYNAMTTALYLFGNYQK